MASSSLAEQSVLVVGGFGFVGYHIVRYFVEHSTFSQIAVLSRSATASKHRVKEGLGRDPPDCYHPHSDASPVTVTSKDYKQVTVQGTRNLLKMAKDSDCVRAFIYTSSSTVAQGSEHIDLAEDVPLANTDPKSPLYGRSKADAEVMVLKANKPLFSPSNKAEDAMSWKGHVATGSLRFPIIYGTHDLTAIPGCLDSLLKGQMESQLSDGKNQWAFCSTENCAMSHALLASALLRSPENNPIRIDGEAFNINDGTSYPFWGFVRDC